MFGIPTDRLLMVGDSGNDVEAARGAGCPVLVVPYGYREGRPVHDLEADGIVESVDALADCVRYVAPTRNELRPLPANDPPPPPARVVACRADAGAGSAAL